MKPVRWMEVHTHTYTHTHTHPHTRRFHLLTTRCIYKRCIFVSHVSSINLLKPVEWTVWSTSLDFRTIPKLGSIDHKLTFDNHISELCKHASRKIHALARVTPVMNISKGRILMNAIFRSQCSYCPLIWMCCSRINNRKINSLRELCRQMIYQDKQYSFEQLLKKTILFLFITEIFSFFSFWNVQNTHWFIPYSDTEIIYGKKWTYLQLKTSTPI